MRKASLGTIFFTVFLDLLGFGLVVPYLPGVAREHGASDLVATLLGAAFSLMQFLFVPLWGHLSDRTGRRPILVVSIAASAIGMLILANATSLWLLFVARIWSGIATSNIAVAQAYIADVTAPHERAKGMGLIGAGIGLGFVIGPGVGGVLEAISPLSRPGALPAYTAAALSSLNLIFALAFLPESLPAEDRGKVVRTASPFNVERFRVALQFLGVGSALIVNLIVVFSFSGMEQTFRLFTEDAFRMDESATGLVLVVVGLILISVQGGLLQPLSKLMQERILIILGVIIQSIGFAAVALSPSFGQWALYGSMSLVSLGSALTLPSLSTYVSKCADAQNQGVALGILQSSGAFARVCGPGLAGALYQFSGHRAPYVAASVGMGVAALVSLRLPQLQSAKT